MSIKDFYKINKEKGIAIYLSVIIMSIILSIVLGLTVILVGQIKMTKDVESSVIAFYGADSGIEQMLYAESSVTNITGSMSLGTGKQVDYEAWRVAEGAETWCLGSTVYSSCIKSVGTYRGTKRAILITM